MDPSLIVLIIFGVSVLLAVLYYIMERDERPASRDLFYHPKNPSDTDRDGEEMVQEITEIAK